MGTTTHGLPFPDGTDPVAQGDDAMEALADAVDLAVYGDDDPITYGANVATAQGGSAVYRRGNTVHLILGFVVSAGISAGATLLTTPVGYRPPVLWRGMLWDATSGSFAMVTITTAGVLWPEVALTNGNTFVGSVAYPLP